MFFGKKEIVIKGIGEVKTCAHCNGSGKCKCPGCGNGVGEVYPCKTCKGAGSNWIGPSTIKIYFGEDEKK